MKKSALGMALRERQRELGQIPAHVLNRLSDEDLIYSCITGSFCGKIQDEGAVLEEAIAAARNAEHFFELVDAIADAMD